MIAARFRTIGWVAGVASAALCCYLVSQSVASERATLAKVDRSIADTQSEIARLATEIGTRGRMSQIDRWNTEAFGLQAPGARQFLASETQLAAFGHPRAALPIDPDVAAAKGAVEQAAYVPKPAPAAPTPVAAEAGPDAAEPQPQSQLPSQPMLRVASYVRPKPDRLGEAAASSVVKVALAGHDPVAAKPSAAKPAGAPTAAKPRPLSLLPDDIDSLAAAEKVTRTHKAPK